MNFLVDVLESHNEFPLGRLLFCDVLTASCNSAGVKVRYIFRNYWT